MHPIERAGSRMGSDIRRDVDGLAQLSLSIPAQWEIPHKYERGQLQDHRQTGIKH